jgi:membrane peptidoglycan carboxypeptidase
VSRTDIFPCGVQVHGLAPARNEFLRLREALGNSLNIPAVKTLKFVGDAAFMERLHAVGITSLTNHPEFYGAAISRSRCWRMTPRRDPR